MTVNNYGDNAFNPGMTSDAYIPDQLIAGDAKIVTDTATITGGAALKRGTALGQVTIGAAGAPTAAGGNTGNGVISVVALGAKAKVGTYTIHFTGATTYDVLNPSGTLIGKGYAAGAYVDAEIGWIFTAGGTAMVAGDVITIAVAAGSGAYKKAVGTATDGSQTPVALLIDDADASGGDVTGGIYLTGEFNANAVILDNSITLATAKAALRLVNIQLKSALSQADPT